MSRRCLLLSGAALFILTAGRTRGDGPWIVEPIARSGDPVPGLPGQHFGGAFSQTIDSSGAVAFYGSWDDPTMSPPLGAGIFYGVPGQTGLIQLRGEHAPGFPAASDLLQYWGGGPRLARTGQIGLLSWVGPSFLGPKRGQYAGVPSLLQLAAYTDGPAPDAPSGTVTQLPNQALINASGGLAYTAQISDPGAPNGTGYTAVITGAPGQQTAIARTGYPVNPISGATFTSFFEDGGVNLNDSGQVGYYATFSGRDVPPGTGLAYFLWSAGETSVVARIGMQAPTLPPGVTFTSLGAAIPGLSNSGRVEFRATVQGPGINGTNASGIWAGTPATFHPVLRAGDTTPGLEPGVHVQTFQSFSISNADWTGIAGQVAGAGVDDSNDQAIWLGSVDAQLEAVFREGSQAPGLPDGLTFQFSQDERVGLTYPQLVLNNSRDLLVLAGLAGSGVTPANNVGLWFRDGDSGNWTALLRTGDSFDGRLIAPYALHSNSIGFAALGGPDATRSQNLLDDGSFVLTLTFTDGTDGVYRFSVPEAHLSPAILAILALLLRRAR